MKLGDTVKFPAKRAYGKHAGHTAQVTTATTVDLYWSCSCGDTWHTANDPDGDLGSEEAPEG